MNFGVLMLAVYLYKKGNISLGDIAAVTTMSMFLT
jgi:predicted HTH domain antitoxin